MQKILMALIKFFAKQSLKFKKINRSFLTNYKMISKDYKIIKA